MILHEFYAYLCVHDTQAAIDFYTRVFGATEKFRLTEPGGRVGHAELALGSTTLMVCDPFPECGIRSARELGGTAVTLHLHVDDADALVARALEAGATLHIPLQDHFYGERSGSFFDPFGHRWLIGHSIEAVTPEEMQRRYTEELGRG